MKIKSAFDISLGLLPDPIYGQEIKPESQWVPLEDIHKREEELKTAFYAKVREIEEEKQKEKAYFKQIVAANNVLRGMPQGSTVYCGSCGQRLKVPVSHSLKNWFEALRSALLFPAAEDIQSEEKIKDPTT